MQNVVHNSNCGSPRDQEGNKERSRSSSPLSGNISVERGPASFRLLAELSESEDDDVSEVESFILEQAELEGPVIDTSKYLLSPDDSPENCIDVETQCRLEALLEASGAFQFGNFFENGHIESCTAAGQSYADYKQFYDRDVLRRLTSSVNNVFEEAACANRMRADPILSNPLDQNDCRSLAEACSDGDIETVKRLLDEGRNVNEITEEGESLLSLACSSGYYELAQLLLAMKANIEDRGLKDTTPLMEAASAGHVEIVKLLIQHGAEVNAQTSQEKRLKGAKNKNQELQLKAQQDLHSNLPSIVCPEGNTPLMFAAAAGHVEVASALLDAGASIEDHNENGHTPLMEAASAGHVDVAKLLVERGSCINTHSNEFKESALTLACYKGHLEMVRFLLEAGADQEHKTDEMHTALMEASMDGHVEVARLLLDSGAQVNMPADSFESPLTLAACGGHVELAMLLLERGANIEEVNDEGYTPLMEAAREGHEEMVALLLSQGADINAQTEETQETALTLACCGGFLEVADFLIKAGADIELGTSTPLMEASQEGHLELVRYLISAGANVNATSTTGDTALTYACENGHTDVADLLLQASAKLEHESEGGRTPLMKAARAGHLCTVQFLITKGSNVNKQTTNNDHNPLSLACAGGHLPIVELLLAHGADPTHKLKDNSTMLIEASKGGHTNVVQLLLDYPNSLLASPPPPPDLSQVAGQVLDSTEAPRVPPHGLQVFSSPDSDQNLSGTDGSYLQNPQPVPSFQDLVRDSLPSGALPTGVPKQKIFQRKLSNKNIDAPSSNFCEGLRYHYRGKSNIAAQVSSIAIHPDVGPKCCEAEHVVCCCEEGGGGIEDDEFIHEDFRHSDRLETCITTMMKKAELMNPSPEEQIAQKQHILEELQRVERELQDKAGSETLLLQSAAQHNVQGFGSVSGVSTSKLEAVLGNSSSAFPNVGSHAQQFLINSGAVLDIESLSSTVMPELSAHLGMNLRTTTAISGASPCPNSLQHLTPQQLYQHSKHVQQQQPSNVSSADHGKPRQPKTCRQVLKQFQQYYQLHPNTQAQGAVRLPSQQMIQPQSLLEDMEKLRNAVLADQAQLHQQHPSPLTNLHQQFLLSELSQNFTLKANTHIAEGPGDALTLMQTTGSFKIAPSDSSQTHAIPIFDPVAVGQVLMQQQPFPTQQQISLALQQQEAKKQQQSFDKNVKILKGATVKALLQTQAGQQQTQSPQQPQHSIKHQLTTACGEACALVGNIPIDAAGVLSLSGMAAPVFPVSLAMLPTTSTATVGTNCGDYREGFLDGLMVAAPARTLHETLGDIVTGPTTQLAGNQMHLSQPGTTSLCSEPCSGARSRSLSMTSLPGVSASSTSLPLAFHGLTPSVTSCIPLQVATSGDGLVNSHHLPHIAHSVAATSPPTPPLYPPLDLNSQTDSNHDTALTLACAGGHDDLVSLLLSRGADIEHRDKKGFTPLMLAATAGHSNVVEILLNHAGDIEAQSERTKDTALSLACSGGRYEVVDILLARGANKEHRNVSDYTPLSLAASGGYVNIIKLLLSHGAEINSRTGSKLGISPLMLAAMNGHSQAVKLLLDMGSDINAQIETNRNTALTLACFQGRHEVVGLLLDRKANVEHRAKTGLTPLMEAASGGYVEVGKVLIDKGADVNAPPVPSSRDTALTIASDKGHYRFVELLLQRDSIVDVKNKKGNSPLWLAANGGHIDVVQLLVNKAADIDSQDNRKVSCLMAAFRKGHLKTVKWMVKHVTQFPSDQEMVRYISTINDKDLLKKCHQCAEAIRVAKDRQAAEANKNANILLEELDQERSREECRKAAAARRRERKRRKKREKQEQLKAAKAAAEETKSSDKDCDPDATQTHSQSDAEDDFDDDEDDEEEDEKKIEPKFPAVPDTVITSSNVETISRVPIDSSSPKRNVTSSSNIPFAGITKLKDLEPVVMPPCSNSNANTTKQSYGNPRRTYMKQDNDGEKVKTQPKPRKTTIVKSSHLDSRVPKDVTEKLSSKIESLPTAASIRNSKKRNLKSEALLASAAAAATVHTNPGNITVGMSTVHTHSIPEMKSHASINKHSKHQKELMMNGVSSSSDYDDYCSIFTARSKGAKYPAESKVSLDAFGELDLQTNDVTFPSMKSSTSNIVHASKSLGIGASPKKWQKRDEGWKEVVRRCVSVPRSKKVSVPSSTISRVIGRGGCNINAIRESSGAHIEVEKQKGQGERTIIIRGSAESTRLAHTLITALIKEPEKELSEILIRCGLNRVGGCTVPFINETSKSTFTLANCAPPVAMPQALIGSLQTKGNSKTTVVSRSSGIVTSAVTKVTSIPPPSLPANSAPPFSHSARSNLPTMQNIRAGVPVSTGPTPPFLNSSHNTWTGVVVTGKVPSNIVPRPGVPLSNPSTHNLTSVSTRMVTTTTVEKSPVVRQLFSQDKNNSQLGTTTSTKTTVSYTMAVIAQGKAPKTVPTSVVTVATKVTSMVDTKVSAVVAGATERAGSAPPGSATMTTHMTIGLNPGLSTVQPFSSNQAARPANNGSMLLQQAAASAIPHMSRVNRCQGPVPSKPFVSSAPTSNLSSPTSNPTSTSAPVSSIVTSAQSSAHPEYSPFNNLFSQMAQPNVWGQKEKEAKPNFASVAAAGVTSVACPIQNTNSVQCTLTLSLPQNSDHEMVIDAAKAPGYRGNLHISPSASSSSSASSILSQQGMSNNPNFGPIGSGPRSAPCTPPLGPIGPPSSSGTSTRRSTPPNVPSPPLQLNSRSHPDSHNVPLSDLTHSMSSSDAPTQHPSSQMSEALFHHQSMAAMSSHASRLQSYPHASTFAGPTGTNTTFSQHSPLSSVGTIGPDNSNNGNLQVVQSNLNPNAPDFSSRASLLMAQHGPPMHHMPQQQQQRLPSAGLNTFQDNSVPPHLAQFRPILTQNSGMNSYPMHPLQGHHPQTMNRFPMHNTTNPQQQVGEYNHNAPPGPIGSMPPGMSNLSQNADTLPLLSMIGSGYATHPTQVIPGNGNMQQHHPYMHSMMGIRPNQRSANVTPSIGSSSKDLNMQENPNPAGTIGEDRKLPRPIGMERAQRKNPVFGGVSDVGGAWSLSSSGRSDIVGAGDWIQNMQELGTVPPLPQEEAGLPPILHNNYIASRYNDILASDSSHNVEHPYQAVASAVSGGGCFPFVNGLPPPMVAAHMYSNPNNTQGHIEQQQIEMWNLHQKLPLSSGEGLPLEHKMTWQNWGPHQA